MSEKKESKAGRRDFLRGAGTGTLLVGAAAGTGAGALFVGHR